MKKEIKEDTRNLKDLPCSWVDRINIAKMAILPKAAHRFNPMFIIIPAKFFTLKEQYSTSYGKTNKQKNQNIQNNLLQQKKFWRHYNC